MLTAALNITTQQQTSKETPMPLKNE